MSTRADVEFSYCALGVRSVLSVFVADHKVLLLSRPGDVRVALYQLACRMPLSPSIQHCAVYVVHKMSDVD